MRHMIRLILESRTYQLSSIPNHSNDLDETFFSHFVPHPMPAQVLLDMVDEALGAYQQFGNFPDQRLAIKSAFPVNNPFTDAFGVSHRSFLTDLDPHLDPNLMQCLTMINSPYIQNKVDGGSTLRQALLVGDTPQKLVNFCFMNILCRPPTAKEIALCIPIMQKAHTRRQGAEDLIWPLVIETR